MVDPCVPDQPPPCEVPAVVILTRSRTLDRRSTVGPVKTSTRTERTCGGLCCSACYFEHLHQAELMVRSRWLHLLRASHCHGVRGSLVPLATSEQLPVRRVPTPPPHCAATQKVLSISLPQTTPTHSTTPAALSYEREGICSTEEHHGARDQPHDCTQLAAKSAQRGLSEQQASLTTEAC